MNQSQIHPALRQTSLSTPSNHKASQYSDGLSSAYSQIQPSPNGSHQNAYYPHDQQLHDSTDEPSPGTNPADPNELKRPRACEACRQLKVKCEPDETNPSGSCKRCAKAHRQCIVTVPSRKRQKKTDSRVAELERKIDALTATLASRAGSNSGGSGGGPDNVGSVVDPVLDPAITHQQPSQQHPSLYTEQWHSPVQHSVPIRSPNQHAQSTGTKRKHQDEAEHFAGDFTKPSFPRYKSPPPLPQFLATYNESKPRQEGDELPYVDVIDRNIIDVQTAYSCFDRYNSEMSQQLPIVVFSPGQTAEVVRKTKPILFLAVIAVGCGTIRLDLQSKLISETTRILGDRIIYNGEKSMELVQTIQLMTVFYQPPERYEELNFNQLIHIAAVMAMDIGMGKRSKKGPYPVWKGYMEKNKSNIDLDSAEVRRCWLGCYYMCTNSAMSLRRPLLVRWSPYADECLQILKTAKDALPSDKWLCHLVKAQHIGENIGVEFSMDDPASVLSLTDLKTQRHLKAFEQNLADWHDSGGDMMNNPIMKHTEAIINLYMHEIAMHHNHNIDDFRPPYNSTPIDGPPDPDLVTPAHIESLTACLHAAHHSFEAFLSMDMTMLRALPTHLFVRNSYAAVALIKLYSAFAAKGSKFGSIFKAEELKVDYYLDRVVQLLHKMAEGGMSKVAYKFTMIFSMLRSWHLKRISNPPNGPNQGDGGQTPSKSKSDTRDHKSGSMPRSQDSSHAWSRSQQEQVSQKQSPQNGLQMLSDAAMRPSGPIPPQVLQGQWVPQQQNGQTSSVPDMDSMGIPGQDFNMMLSAYGGPGDNIGMGAFTSDDFMAFGLGDDWTSFGFPHAAGWA